MALTISFEPLGEALTAVFPGIGSLSQIAIDSLQKANARPREILYPVLLGIGAVFVTSRMLKFLRGLQVSFSWPTTFELKMLTMNTRPLIICVAYACHLVLSPSSVPVFQRHGGILGITSSGTRVMASVGVF